MHDRTGKSITTQMVRGYRARGMGRGAAALLAVAWLGAGAHAEPGGSGQPGGMPQRGFAVAAGTLAAQPLPALALAPPRAQQPDRALDDERLAALRGGTDTPWSDMKLNGTVGNNAATNVVTGSNIITDGAFTNASGLPMVIQNSGANVLIQNATIVNLQLR